MRLLSLFGLILCCSLISQPAFAEKKNYQVLSIGFYNLENFFDPADDPNRYDEDFTPGGAFTYTEEVYRQKVHNMAYAISRMGIETTPDGPAFMGITEVENDKVIKDLIAAPELRDRKMRYVWFEGPDMRGIDVAFIYNPKYFSVISSTALKVNLRESGNVKAGGTRDILWVRGMLLGDTVNVFVNHWPSRRGGEAASAPLRAIAARVPRTVIDSLIATNPGTRAFVMGDLNDDPVSPSVVKVLRSTHKRNKVDLQTMYNPWVEFYNKGIGTIAFQDSWGLFDQIIFTKPVLDADPKHWSYYRAEVFNKDFLIEKFGQYKGYAHRSHNGSLWQNGYSDHFPVLVYLVKGM